MGKVITLAEYKRLGWVQRGILPVFCCRPSGSAEPVSLNHRLAELLQKVPIEKRSRKLKDCLDEALKELPEYSLVGSFDVLFHPDYKVDVLTTFIQLAKFHPMALLWPGTISSDQLAYAEPGCQDYHAYQIKNYDIICIVEDA